MTDPRSLILAAALLASGMFVTACAQPEIQDPPEVYSARGMIRQLPDANGADKTVFIHHEAIPEFRDQDGQVVGMNSMAMPFPAPDLELLQGFEVGDRVSFEFEISWTGQPPMALRKIEKLPADSPLSFLSPPPSKTEEGTPPADHSQHSGPSEHPEDSGHSGT